MAETFTLDTKSVGKNDKRRVTVTKNPNSKIPFKSVAKQLASMSE